MTSRTIPSSPVVTTASPNALRGARRPARRPSETLPMWSCGQKHQDIRARWATKWQQRTGEKGSIKRLWNLVLVPPAGLEPAPFGLGNRCSIRLSYGGTRTSIQGAAHPRGSSPVLPNHTASTAGPPAHDVLSVYFGSRYTATAKKWDALPIIVKEWKTSW